MWHNMACKFLLRLRKGSLCLGLLPLLFLSPSVSALDIGFEFIARTGVSDNLFQDLPGEEIEGGIGLGELAVFGQHNSPAVEAGFLGELSLRRRLASDDDITGNSDDTATLSRFYGSAEFNVTRSFSWFFGNVLGGTTSDTSENVTADSDDVTNRRNVLVTGPILDFQLDSVRQLTGHLFFIDNSDSIGTEFADFYEAEIAYQQEMTGGLTMGLKVDSLIVRAGEDSSEPDFVRTTAGITGIRSRDVAKWTAFLGATAYQSEGEEEYETVGVSARLRYERRNTEFSYLYAELSRAIVDQALNETQNLLVSSSVASAGGSGIYNDTLLSAGYEYIDSRMSYRLGAGIGTADYDAVLSGGSFVEAEGDEEDENRYYINGGFFRVLTPKINVGIGAGYSNTENVVGDDFSESLYGSLSFGYKLSTSFTFRASMLHGIRDGFDSDSTETQITDSTENRFFIALSYAPPTRADRDQAARLRSLLF